MYRVTTERLSADALADAVTVPEAGAVAVFLGVARNNNAGRRGGAPAAQGPAPRGAGEREVRGGGVGGWPEGQPPPAVEGGGGERWGACRSWTRSGPPWPAIASSRTATA